MSFSDEDMKRLEKLVKLSKYVASQSFSAKITHEPTIIIFWESLADRLQGLATEFRMAAEIKRKEIIERMGETIIDELNSGDDSLSTFSDPNLD